MDIDKFRAVRNPDAETIAQLANSAYRPESGVTGWTNESDLVMKEETLNLEQEAVWVRNRLEQSDKKNIPLITEDFPIMNCKLSSMLVAYHLIFKYPNLIIHGVSGRAKNWKGLDEISHYWLEVGEILIDITSDQYNKIDIDELNGQFASYIPFKSVYVGPKYRQPQYYLFKKIDRDVFTDGFPDIGEDFIEKLEISHRHLNDRK